MAPSGLTDVSLTTNLAPRWFCCYTRPSEATAIGNSVSTDSWQLIGRTICQSNSCQRQTRAAREAVGCMMCSYNRHIHTGALHSGAESWWDTRRRCHGCKQTQIHTNRHKQTQIHTHTHMSTQTDTHLHKYTHIHTCLHMSTQTDTNRHTSTHKQTHIYTNRHKQTQIDTNRHK